MLTFKVRQRSVEQVRLAPRCCCVFFQLELDHTHHFWFHHCCVQKDLAHLNGLLLTDKGPNLTGKLLFCVEYDKFLFL